MTIPTPNFPLFLSEAWWQLILDNWNTHASRSTLGGLGVVAFETEGGGFNAVTVRFAEEGTAELVDPSTPLIGRFRATEANWRSFIFGRFSATEGVVRGRIQFAGSYFHVLRYANAFDTFAQAASRFLKPVE